MDHVQAYILEILGLSSRSQFSQPLGSISWKWHHQQGIGGASGRKVCYFV